MTASSSGSVPEDSGSNPTTICGESDDKVTVIFLDESIHNRNTTRLLQLLPEEIWSEVLEKLDWRDKQQASNASVLFRNILSHERIMFLFPDVWLIYAKFVELERESLWRKGLSREKMLELSPTYELTKLRLVCRHWRNSMDHVVEMVNASEMVIRNDMLPFGEYVQLDKDDTIQDIMLTKHRFLSWARYYFPQRHAREVSIISRFMNIFSECQSDTNPFIGRQVEIVVDCDKNHYTSGNCSLQQEVSAFLLQWGKHIRYLCLRNERKQALVETLQQFSAWLALVPNLQILHWKHEIYIRDVRSNMIESVTFPTLPHLQVINFDDVQPLIGEKFLQKNCNVVVFQPHSKNPDWPKICVLNLGVTLRNLSQVSILIQSVEEFTQLEKAQQTWQLTKLELLFEKGFMTKDTFVEWWRIFKVLERWKETLRVLALDLPEPTNLEEAHEILNNKDTRVDLPHVFRLRIHMFSVRLINFFIRLQLLEVLEIETGGWFAVSDKLSPHYGSYCIENSSVWQVFPKLRRINKWTVNTRDAHAFLGFFRRRVVKK